MNIVIFCRNVYNGWLVFAHMEVMKSCNYCGRGLKSSDEFFMCKDEWCSKSGKDFHCKACTRQCEKCMKFFCIEHVNEHKQGCEGLGV